MFRDSLRCLVACLAAACVPAICGCGGSTVQEVAASADAVQAAEAAKPVALPAGDWPWWRGPSRQGVVAGDAQPPIQWSEDENIIWKAPVPGRGHSSPTIVGDRVFLATADEEVRTQSVICFDRETGEQLWLTVVHRGETPLSYKSHRKSTDASSTVACDGERLVIAFLNAGGVWVTALDLDGKQLWQKRLGDFNSSFGYAPSPVIYRSLAIVAADHSDGGYLAAVNRENGEIVWLKQRPANSSYASPIVADVAGKPQLLIAGCNQVSSYNPLTGEELWTARGTTDACAGTMAYEGDLVFASGGYPGRETLAVKADGSGEVVWRNREKAYVPSLLAHDGYLYMVSDDGRAFCWQASTGKEMWKTRLNGQFSASPVLVNGHIYISSEGGETIVFKATSAGYEEVARNRLGNETMATLAVAGDRIFLRASESASGPRHETLYCIGVKDAEE